MSGKTDGISSFLVRLPSGSAGAMGNVCGGGFNRRVKSFGRGRRFFREIFH
jgi:hypothetical protein